MYSEWQYGWYIITHLKKSWVKMLGKKAKLDVAENWVEYAFFVLLVLGFFFSAGSGSAVMSYIMIFLCSMMGGRLLYRLKKDSKVPWVIILIGFLIGFVMGSFYANKRIITVCYIAGIWLSYYIHDKDLIHTTEF